MTNRDAFRGTSSPLCEYHPALRREAFLSDAYHGIATVELLSPTGRQQMRVCIDCAEKHFPDRTWRRPLRRFGAPAW